MDAVSADKRFPGQWLIERFGGKARPQPGPTTLDSDTTLYMYVRNSVTKSNASLDPVPVQERDAHFLRLTLARDHGGNPIIPLDPRGIYWFFGASNLPYGQHSVSFGNRAYFAWDYDPGDPILTRAMAYEVVRVSQQKRLGGELAFAKTCSESCCDLLDQSTGHKSRRQQERQYVAISWWQWWQSRGRRKSTASPEVATCPSSDEHEDSVCWQPAS